MFNYRNYQDSRLLLSGAALIGLCGFGINAWADHTSVGVGVGTGSPIFTDSGATLPRNRWAANVRTSFVSNDNISDQELLSNPGAHSVGNRLIPSFGAFYGVTDNLTIGFRLPYIARHNIHEAEHEHEGGEEEAGHDEEEATVQKLGTSNGIGDLDLFGQYRFLNYANTHHASIFLGVEAPTGKTDATSLQGERFETDLQPGSGSWDGLFGLAYSYWFAPFAFDSSILYTLTTDGAQDTNLGDIFNYNFALSYRLTGGQPEVFYAERRGFAWDLTLELNGEWQGKADTAGIVDNNTGWNIVYFSPGIRVTKGGNISLGVSCGVPVVSDLNGVQNDPNYRLIASLGISY